MCLWLLWREKNEEGTEKYGEGKRKWRGGEKREKKKKIFGQQYRINKRERGGLLFWLKREAGGGEGRRMGKGIQGGED